MESPVHVIGASGRSGAALTRALLREGCAVVPVVRDLDRWARQGIVLPARQADLRDPESLRRALGDARMVASCAHARFAGAILAATDGDARFVFLGSTRKFTQWPDSHGNGVLAGEAALMASGRPGIMLHPTMIYGAQGENNVQRLAALLRRLRVMPLPEGGRFLVQPIHQGDVTRCILSALRLDLTAPESIVIAGLEPVRYADLIRAVAHAAGLPRPILLPFPARPLITAARMTRHIRALPRIEPEEVRRLLEDKAFDTTTMRTRLGIEPIPLVEGLAATFSAA